MDEYVKATPSVKKIMEQLSDLKPFERVEVICDENGKPDTYLVVRQSKFLISGGVIRFVR